jgi:N-acetylneuraminate synthase
VDASFSLEPEEFASLCLEAERAWKALGQVHYGPTVAEEASKTFGRSIYITKDLSAGDRLSVENVQVIRPGLGLKPKYFDIVMGRRLKTSVRRGTPLSWALIE